jgi:hypothetical protein
LEKRYRKVRRRDREREKEREEREGREGRGEEQLSVDFSEINSSIFLFWGGGERLKK